MRVSNGLFYLGGLFFIGGGIQAIALRLGFLGKLTLDLALQIIVAILIGIGLMVMSLCTEDTKKPDP